ncbi:hypothetical protein [Ligilactobacillus ruminis]|uniref:hypothetical protein n=2 Tax=Ligilactobacillus ruminis TaxID=1623 RepID=UPI0015F33D9F|nr:hypothetical protein [Ligilactobacillus ruminis]
MREPEKKFCLKSRNRIRFAINRKSNPVFSHAERLPSVMEISKKSLAVNLTENLTTNLSGTAFKSAGRNQSQPDRLRSAFRLIQGGKRLFSKPLFYAKILPTLIQKKIKWMLPVQSRLTSMG